MQNCERCYPRIIYKSLYTNIENSRIDEYYSESKIYPPLSNRENVIIAADTTFESFQKYCEANKIKAFDILSIDSIVVVALAAKMGNLDLLTKLVDKIGNTVVNTCDRNYFTPLHIVCHETRSEGVVFKIEQLCAGAKKLIELGANPNIASGEGFTPLGTSALKSEYKLLTDLLIQNNGKINPCGHPLKTLVDDKWVSSAELIKVNLMDRVWNKIKFSYSNSDFSVLPFDLFEFITQIYWDSLFFKRN